MLSNNYRRTVTVTLLIFAALGFPAADVTESEVIVYFPLDSDPHWQITENSQWAFGQPAGQGAADYGHPDPTAGATGDNVYGVNLDGDYSTTVGGPYYLTAGPFDCAGWQNVQLQFQRWLNTDQQDYVFATLEVSRDQKNWSEIWSNPATAITDSAWVLCNYDISAVADQQKTVYIRWGHEVASPRAYPYSGWNIDDVCLLGHHIDPLKVLPDEDFYCQGPQGGPFSAPSKQYTLSNQGPNDIEWAVQTNTAWLNVSPLSGTLAPADTNTVIISLNSYARDLEPDVYQAEICFRNLTSGIDQPRTVNLTVNQQPGQLHIIDSIEPPNDLEMPFAEIIVGRPRTEQLSIANLDPDPRHELIVEQISLGYLQDFNDGQAPYWQEDNTTQWDIISGQLVAFPFKFTKTQSIYTAMKWQDLSAQVKIQRTHPDYDAGLIVRASDNFSYPASSGSAYIISEDGNGFYWIARCVSGSWTYLQFLTFCPELNTGGAPNLIKVVLEGANIEVYFNGRLAWSGTDTSIPGPGRIGLFAYRGPADDTIDYYFDDVKVQSLAVTDEFSLTLPPGGPPWTLTAPPQNQITLDVNFAPRALGPYQSNLFINSNDTKLPEANILLSGTGILDYLQVAPDTQVLFSGHPGGPFVPSYIYYELQNLSPYDINWAAQPNATWLDVEPHCGNLKPAELTKITIAPNDQAYNLPQGNYHCDLLLQDLTTGINQIRKVSLDVYTKSKIWVSPPSFRVTVPQGTSVTKTLTIGNTGDSTLNFIVSCSGSGPPPADLQTTIASAVESNDMSISPPAWLDFTTPTDAPFADGELLVHFSPKADKSWPNTAEMNAILRDSGACIKHQYKLVPGLSLVKLPPHISVAEALLYLNHTNGILYAEPNYELKALATFPSDPRFDELWAMLKIQAPQAWDITTGNNNIIVAVIDTGIDYTHPDLAANIWLNPAEDHYPVGTIGPEDFDGLDDDNNGWVDDICGYDYRNNDANPMDDNGHGTHCAGIIGAVANNDQGVAGVCWNVRLMALKLFPASGKGGKTDDAIKCIEYATQMGANVINGSWGSDEYSQGLKDAINAAGQAGVLVVAAAGNALGKKGKDNDVEPYYPASYPADNIIAVMASDENDERSYWPEVNKSSHYGLTSVDLAAPGSSILSTLRLGTYDYKSGTSMAAPHVAGACALVWSVNPSLSPLTVKNIILQTVDHKTTLDRLCASGGRLNLHHAVLAAQATNYSTCPWLNIAPQQGTVAPAEVNQVTLTFRGNQQIGTYLCSISIVSNDPYRPNIYVPVTMIVNPIDYFTELFNPTGLPGPAGQTNLNTHDLANHILTFIPDGSASFYQLCTHPAAQLPVDPHGGTTVSLKDDDYIQVNLQNDHLNFYGTNYQTFYIGSNGYITFLSGDIRYAENLEDHFELPRISALFNDLDPSAGGKISWKKLSDRVAVTFENVPQYSLSSTNTFQVEMFFNGAIRITCLDIAAKDGLVGLSDGNGRPLYFTESDLSEYGLWADLDSDCDVEFHDYAGFASAWLSEDCGTDNDWCLGADLRKDGTVDFLDLAILARHWLECIRPDCP